MEFVQAQFSLKFEPKIRIRRNVNEIEDYLQEHYGTPQTMPIPDDFAAEAPRIVLKSKNGHSQISFSQISVDFTVNFDGEYREKFELTQEYILKRILILKELLEKIEINTFFFCGVSYNCYLDTMGKSNIDYISSILHIDQNENIYEASRRIASVYGEKFFVNEQVGTYKEYQSKGISIPNLIDFKNSKLVSEGISLSIDVNNRYEYLQFGKAECLDKFDELINEIFYLIESNLKKWR